MAAKSADIHDVIVVGANPAGCAAAICARKQDLSVLVLEQESFPRHSSFMTWIGEAGVKLCEDCGLSAKLVGAKLFAGLDLYSWDLKRDVRIEETDLGGWLVDRAAFDHALLKRALKAGARAQHGVVPTELALLEDHAAIGLSDGRTVQGKVVLIADGVLSPTARLAHITAAGQMRDLAHCALVRFETKSNGDGLTVIVGGGGGLARGTGGRTSQLATILRGPRETQLTLLTRDAGEPVAQQLTRYQGAVRAAGLLPDAPGRPPLTSICPAGVALDMDSHVGKRCLLIGDAGGFVAAFSAESVYPGMKSGWIAAETAARALAAPVPQDELATFGAAWRSELADYLRMPNTDLSLLMPLVFNNSQMSQRVARAFLLGRKF